MPLDPPLDASPDAIRDALAPLRNGLSVAVVAAGNPFAVGAIIRVAHSFLVREILLIGTEPHYEKASMGLHHLETIVRLPDTDAFFAHIAGRPLWALEREQCRRSLYTVASFPPDAVLAFGSERAGFPPGFLDRCDDVLGIPLYGVNNSLPVAIAAGITLSWWGHLRYAPGTTLLTALRRSPRRVSRRAWWRRSPPHPSLREGEEERWTGRARRDGRVVRVNPLNG